MNRLLDLTELLRPITPENPAGMDLEYECVFDEIRAARESDPSYLPQDEWAFIAPRKADWDRVAALSKQALCEKSKDLQLACWFIEALGHQHGISGLLAGIKFLNEFISCFWFQCWPALADDGLAIRRGRLARLDRDISQLLLFQALLNSPMSSLSCWKQVQAFEHKISTNPEQCDDFIEHESELSMADFEREAASFSAVEIDQQTVKVGTLTTALIQLNADYLSLSQDPDGDLFTHTQLILSEIADYLQRLSLRVFRKEEELVPMNPDNGDKYEGGEIMTHEKNGKISNRETAVNQMLAIARYFRQTEPSSPVPFLMERAARWANMSLTEWLEEMLSDSACMRDINQVLTGQTTP